MLKRHQIDIDPSSYVDPQGFLFRHDEDIYRCIRPNARPLFEELEKSGLLKRLQSKHNLIESSASNLRIDAEPEGLVLSHPRIEPISYCNEWCPGMLWDAARITLDLAIELADEDLVLQDAYPWNILFDGAKGIFVDLTSIARPEGATLWPAHEQYESYFWRPLALMNEGKGHTVRALLTNNIQGIDLETFARLASMKTLLRWPGTMAARAIERKLQANTALKAKAQTMAQKAATQSDPKIRKRFLERLRKRLTPLRRKPGGDCWTNYYAEIDPDFDKQAKLEIVGSLLEKHGGKTVLDLGCNTGVFSIEAAKRGARVYSVDASESCIDLLYETAKTQELAITPLLANIACPTPSGGFMGQQYAPLFERIQADTVLCLGLMHHLYINARQSFERIALLLDAVCHKTLIFEFVGIDDANISLLSRTRKIDYSFDTVRDALSTHFKSIEINDSDRPQRKILLCRK